MAYNCLCNFRNSIDLTTKTSMNIKPKDIEIIKDLALSEFRNTPSFRGLDAKSIQFYCMFKALNAFLTSRGVEPSFDGVLPVEHDSLPVDESGLDEMETPDEQA